jgi:hypothetical protein
MTTTTPTIFLADFPEFVGYQQSAIQYWLNLAYKMLAGSQTLGAQRWGSLLDQPGVELFAAHNLVLEKLAQNSARTGAVPGFTTGVTASKSVGPVSVSYNTDAGMELDAGHWNLTTYGTRFISLARMVGSGGFQVI